MHPFAKYESGKKIWEMFRDTRQSIDKNRGDYNELIEEAYYLDVEFCENLNGIIGTLKKVKVCSVIALRKDFYEIEDIYFKLLKIVGLPERYLELHDKIKDLHYMLVEFAYEVAPELDKRIALEV